MFLFQSASNNSLRSRLSVTSTSNSTTYLSWINNDAVWSSSDSSWHLARSCSYRWSHAWSCSAKEIMGTRYIIFVFSFFPLKIVLLKIVFSHTVWPIHTKIHNRKLSTYIFCRSRYENLLPMILGGLLLQISKHRNLQMETTACSEVWN